LDGVLFIPANCSPFIDKKEVIGGDIRYRMLRLALNGFRGKFFPSKIEIGRPAPSYFIDTLKVLEKTYRNHELYLILGVDQLMDFYKWKDYDIILGKVKIIAMNRDIGREVNILNIPHLDKYADRIRIIVNEPIDVSSSEIRQKVEETGDPGNDVDVNVRDFIMMESIYYR